MAQIAQSTGITREALLRHYALILSRVLILSARLLGLWALNWLRKESNFSPPFALLAS